MKSYMTNLMLTRKSILRMAMLLGSILTLSYGDVQASHIVGGDLTYRCLGGNQYEIRLTMRRDCLLGDPDAFFDNPASVAFFDGATNVLLSSIGFNGQLLMPYMANDTLDHIEISDCSVISGLVCVHQTTYIDTIFLPFRPTGYIMAYQRCCRNMSITNVLDPDDTGMTLVAELSALAQTECNSSPQFGDYPPIYTCVNKEISYDHSAFDVEGDSLVYSLCTPYAGATRAHPKPQPPSAPPYDLITYRPPYNLSNLMGGVPLQIDPMTGLITGTPNTIGQFVIGICVTSYRNGVMTGTTRRDFQYNVRMCRDVPIPAFSAPSLNCENLTVVFDNQSQLADEYLWIFDFGNPNSATSTEFEPTYTYSQGGCYDVALIVNVVEGNERFCPDTIIHQVCVFESQVDAEFEFDVSSCTEDIVVDITDMSNDPDPNHDVITWGWVLTVDSNVFLSADTNPQFSFPIDGSATVLVALQVTSSNGCTATQVHSFPVNQINIPIDPNSGHLCSGDSTGLLLGADDNFTYIWDPLTDLFFPGGDTSDPIAHPTTSVVYSVTATDGLCEVTATIPVEVQQLPVLDFSYSTDCKSLEVTFNNNSTGLDSLIWDFGTGATSNMENPTYVFPDSGIYTVTLSSLDGCPISLSQEVTANAIESSVGDAVTNCFLDSIALNPGFVTGYIYVWSDGLGEIDNPYVSVTDDKTFYVTISSPGLPGCEIVDSVRVLVPDDFTVSAGPDTTRCDFADIVLTATSNGNVDFVWTDGENNILSTEANVIVNAIETDTFYVTATDTLGCSKSDAIIVIRQPANFMVDAGPDTSYCDIQTITLVGTSNIPGVTFEWVSVTTGDTIADNAMVEVTPGTHSCFQLIGTETVSGCQVAELVCLTPTFFDLEISGDQSICLDEVVNIVVSDNSQPQQVLSYVWSPSELIDSLINNNSVAIVSPSETTTYTVTVTNDSLGCTAILSSEVVVNLFDPFTVVITATPPEIILTEPALLTVNQPAHFGYVWSASNGDSIPGVFNPTVFPTDNPTTYTVTVTNEEGCTQVASITVGVKDPLCNEEDIFLPNAFTPNDDGKNDILYVRSNFVSSLELNIYNRWGQKVFTTTDINIGWDGTFNGKRLPPDVYGYYMEIGCPNQKTYFEKGNITLLE